MVKNEEVPDSIDSMEVQDSPGTDGKGITPALRYEIFKLKVTGLLKQVTPPKISLCLRAHQVTQKTGFNRVACKSLVDDGDSGSQPSLFRHSWTTTPRNPVQHSSQ